MPSYVVKKADEILREKGKNIGESTIVLLGLAYKGSSGDTRESPALRVAELLTERGCILSAVDDYVAPYSWPSSIERFIAGALTQADLAILLTDHPVESYQQALSISEVVLDTRNVLEGAHIVRI